MVWKMLTLLILAGAASALEPQISLSEQPMLIMHPGGMQEYYLEYTLTVRNPSEKNRIQYFIANYSLHPGFEAYETDENFSEKKAMGATGRIQTGSIEPTQIFEYYYRIKLLHPPFRVELNTSGKEVFLRIYNSSTQLELNSLGSDAAAVSTNAGTIEAGKIKLSGEHIPARGELQIKAVFTATPSEYRLEIGGLGSPIGSLQIEKISTESMLSVEKQNGAGGHQVTISYLNPTEFTQEIEELKLLRAKAPSIEETVWKSTNNTEALPGQSLGFRIEDASQEMPFYWYSARIQTKYNFSIEQKGAVLRAETAPLAAPTGFSLLGLGKNAPNVFKSIFEALKNIVWWIFAAKRV